MRDTLLLGNRDRIERFTHTQTLTLTGRQLSRKSAE